MAEDWLNIDWAAAMGDARLAWTLLLLGAMAVGLVLWALGGKLAKAGTVLAGLVLGGVSTSALALGLASSTTTGPWVLVFGLGGAIAGALLAWLLFRLWMGLTAAALFALVVPTVVLIWNPAGVVPAEDAAEVATSKESADSPSATATDLMDVLARTIREGVSGTLGGDVSGGADAESEEPGSLDASNVAAGLSAAEVQERAVAEAGKLWDSLKSAWSAELERVRGWWDGLAMSTRTTVLGGSAVGAFLGLVLGLVFPNLLARLQTAFAGSLLLFFPAGVLMSVYVLPPLNDAGLSEADQDSAGVAGLIGVWPTAPREVLMVLGLITILGLVLQCTLFRAKADR